VRVQIDGFKDNGWAVLLLDPDGPRSVEAPRELSPEGAPPPVDAFETRFERDLAETQRLARKNRRLMDELLGGEG
jgi:hypothetical protein